MSARATHFYHISTDARVAIPFEDIVKYANAYVKNLQETCKKKNYACLALVCISENECNLGGVEASTRNHKVYVPISPRFDIKKNPHLHIVILANPCETLSQYTKMFFKKRNLDTFPRCCDNDTHLKNTISYAIRQSLKFRVASYNIDALPKDMLKKFYTLAEEANKLTKTTIPVFKKISSDYFQEDPVND